jgi:hypothetical protein
MTSADQLQPLVSPGSFAFFRRDTPATDDAARAPSAAERLARWLVGLCGRHRRAPRAAALARERWRSASAVQRPRPGPDEIRKVPAQDRDARRRRARRAARAVLDAAAARWRHAVGLVPRRLQSGVSGRATRS